MGKASVSNIAVPLGFVVSPKALAMARLSVVATPLAILPLPPTRCSPLAPYCPFSWHLTAKTPPRLAPYCSPSLAGIPSASWLRSPIYPPRLLDPSSVTHSCGIALPPQLPPTPWIDVINWRTHMICHWPMVSVVFPCPDHTILSLPGPERALEQPSFLLF